LEPLERLGFAIVGYGCTTCIGNSGALTPAMADAVGRGLRAVAVLSGNRNFPGRVHPDLEHGFLASPPMVVAFALAGHVALDILKEPIATGAGGQPVHLTDLWPTGAEIDASLAAAMDAADFETAYTEAAANPLWCDLDAPKARRFPWDAASTYLRRPPFATASAPVAPDKPARALLVLGDDITTDHISPANQIRAESEAGRWLIGQGDPPQDLNVFAARRGNFEAMIRGAFTNRLAVNRLTPGEPAGVTRHMPSSEIVTLPEASRRYAAEGVPLVIAAGERYGMGSSRDWAAKAVALLGVRAVIAKSIERIHRTNLIGMGVLPLLLPCEVTVDSLAITSEDVMEMDFDFSTLTPRASRTIIIRRPDGDSRKVSLTAAIETSLEVDLLRAGGMIPKVLRDIISAQTESQEAAA
jgi:aconitate hydratase